MELNKKYSDFKKKKKLVTPIKKEIKPSLVDDMVAKWKNHRSIKKLETKVKSVGSEEKKKKKKVEKARDKDIRKTIKKVQKKKQKLTPSQKRRHFKKFLEMAGHENMFPHHITQMVFRIDLAILTVATIYLTYVFATVADTFALTYIFTVIGLIWTFGFILLLLILWMAFYLILDLQMFNRRLAVEAVLPDFLQLTSANIRAGMPIDQALWYAVRPRFGVLAKEIEIVAKETLSGTDLNSALTGFANKYDSVILKRSVSLLIEGIEAGGEIGDLLNKISRNIQETRIMKKEMAASVTTYVIFISFATAMAAPVMFALSAQLLQIIQNITGKLASNNVESTGALSFSITGDAVSMGDFHIFAIVTLILTSLFSSMIIATIKKGSVKEGISSIPSFIIVTLIMYWLALKVLGGALGGLI